MHIIVARSDYLPFHTRTRWSAITWFVCCNLLLALYYDWFRYPFQIGDSGTSPTYKDTPAWISAGKYLIFLLFCFVILQSISRNRRLVHFHRPLCVLAYIYLCMMGAAYGLACGLDKICGYSLFLALPQTDLFKVPLDRFLSLSLFLIAATLLHIIPIKNIDFKPIYTVLRIGLFIYLLADALQILLFVVAGRLPAEGFEGSILVRFGGLMDKPNYFGILIPLFFGVAIRGHSRAFSKVLTITLLSVALVLTLSFTAWVATSVSISLYALVSWRHYVSTRVFRTCVIVGLIGFMTITVVWIRYGSSMAELYEDVWSAKSISAEVHQHSIDALPHSFSISNVIGLEPNYVEASEESGYVDTVLIEGCIYLLVYIVIVAYALLRCIVVLRRRPRSQEQFAVTTAAFCFLSASLVSGLSLPIQAMFPLNLLITIFVGLSNSGALEVE